MFGSYPLVCLFPMVILVNCCCDPSKTTYGSVYLSTRLSFHRLIARPAHAHAASAPDPALRLSHTAGAGVALAALRLKLKGPLLLRWL